MEEWHVVARPVPGPAERPRRGARAARVLVVAVAGLSLGALGGWRGMAVVRPEEPLPSRPGAVVRLPGGGEYAYLRVHSDGEPVRWNPCEPIHVVANLDAAPPSAGPDVTEALARLAEATGLRFVYDGPTTEAPRNERPRYQPERYGDRWAPLLVAWYPFSRTDLEHAGRAAGLGGPDTVVAGRHHRAVTGQVLLDSQQAMPPGFDHQGAHGAVLMHEFAHALGLGHVTDPREVMYGDPRYAMAARIEWGRGDRAGLRSLGRSAGCFDVPAPRG